MSEDYQSDDIEAIAQQISEEEKTGKESPRSKLVEAILLLLYARPLRTAEIATNLGYETKYISSYLSYWKKKGLVYQEGGRWHLSRRGENIARDIIESQNNSKFKEYLLLAKQVLEGEKVYQTKTTKLRKEMTKKHKKFCGLLREKPVMKTKNNKRLIQRIV